MAVYFSIILVIITVVTGIVWFADKLYLAPQRKLKAAAAQVSAKQLSDTELTPKALASLTEPSPLVDTAVQIFPVIAFVLILRSFLYEPFQIPSGSMMPTLLDGDFILVNKFNYGLKDPVARHKFFENGLPEYGDVVVFKLLSVLLVYPAIVLFTVINHFILNVLVMNLIPHALNLNKCSKSLLVNIQGLILRPV